MARRTLIDGETPEQFERGIARQQDRLASILQFDLNAKVCAACGTLIYPDDTLPCRGVSGCEARGRE